MKKIKASFLVLLFTLTAAFLSAKPINQKISSMAIVSDMGFGWNLGNTLDATGNATLNCEKVWGQPLTTKAMIDGLASSGIKTIRIPVSWHDHITNKKTYTIDSAWMNRVKTIVDWAIADNMYVIINIHHDNAESLSGVKTPGTGFYPNKANEEESIRYVTKVWEQISKTFNNDYDEHLIFEVLNEPRLVKHNHEWNPVLSCKDCKEAEDCVNTLNQKAVETIRASGGNNANRFIGIPGVVCAPSSVLSNGFVIPKDSANDKILIAVHMYTPYSFAMDPRGDLKTFTPAYQAELENNLVRLQKKFTANNIGLYIGEMGATNKNNLEEREKWFSYFVKSAKAKNMACILWDNGAYDVSSGNFNEAYGYYCRTQAKWYFPTLIKAAVTAAGSSYKAIPAFEAPKAAKFNYDDKKAKEILGTTFDTLCWSKSYTFPGNTFANVKEGSVLCIKTEPSASNDKGYRKLSFRDKSWKEFDAFTGKCVGDGTLMDCSPSPTKDSTTYYFVLSAEDAAALKKQPVLICGNNVKVVSIKLQE